jgi:hypothetical protein
MKTGNEIIFLASSLPAFLMNSERQV